MPVDSEDVVRSESIIETIEQYDDEVTSNNQIDLEYIDAQEVPQDTYEEAYILKMSSIMRPFQDLRI